MESVVVHLCSFKSERFLGPLTHMPPPNHPIWISHGNTCWFRSLQTIVLVDWGHHFMWWKEIAELLVSSHVWVLLVSAGRFFHHSWHLPSHWPTAGTLSFDPRSFCMWSVKIFRAKLIRALFLASGWKTMLSLSLVTTIPWRIHGAGIYMLTLGVY